MGWCGCWGVGGEQAGVVSDPDDPNAARRRPESTQPANQLTVDTLVDGGEVVEGARVFTGLRLQEQDRVLAHAGGALLCARERRGLSHRRGVCESGAVSS